MGKNKKNKEENDIVKKAEEDEESMQSEKRSDLGNEILPKEKSRDKSASRKHKIKPKKKKIEYQSSRSSESSSRSSSQSQSGQQSYSRRSGRKKIPKAIKNLIDIEADSQSQEISSIDTDPEQQYSLKNEEKQKPKFKHQKTMNQKILQNLAGKTEEEVNQHYRDLLKNIDAREQNQMMDNYRHRHQHDLYQIKCAKGNELYIVMCILNKSRYVSQHGNFYCNVVSALAVPKKFPGYIFLEGKSQEDLRKSLENFKQQINLSTLKKIEFQIYSHLFDQAYIPINDYKVQQYVKIKVGAYKNDIGQITKLNKKGAVIQVIPRISFNLINLRMSQIDGLGKDFNATEIMKIKNQILKRLTSSRVTYRPEDLPAKKKLSQSDFFMYNEFPHNKNIKITEDGLILATYSYNEIQCPKTTVNPQEILELNRPTQDPGALLKQVIPKIKMECDIRPNQLVQIISGELKGIIGRVYESTSKIVKLMCLNSSIKGQIIDEHRDNLQKKFKEGQKVVVIYGSNKGQQGIVYKNGSDTVSILTENNQKIECLKSNVQTQLQARVNFQNDLGYKIDNLINIRGQVGIVCKVKKMYVDYVNTSNKLLRAKNGEFDKIAYTNHESVTRDAKQVGKNCLVQVLQGSKKEKVLRVKYVYKGWLFLHEESSVQLCGNWVQRSDNCNLFIKSAPRLEAQFLNNNRWGFRNFGNPNRPNFNKHQFKSRDDNDSFKVGSSYMIVHGVYKGVKGVIVSTFKDHIEVRVLRDKIVSVPRNTGDDNQDECDKRSVAESVASNFVRKQSSRKMLK